MKKNKQIIFSLSLVVLMVFGFQINTGTAKAAVTDWDFATTCANKYLDNPCQCIAKSGNLQGTQTGNCHQSTPNELYCYCDKVSYSAATVTPTADPTTPSTPLWGTPPPPAAEPIFPPLQTLPPGASLDVNTGCCILNTSATPSSANCKKDSIIAECSGAKNFFVSNDPKCTTAKSVSSCGASSNPAAAAAANTTSATTAGSTVSIPFVNPIGFTSVSGVVGALINNLKGIIAWIAILFIVIGGTMYILSAGNEKMITQAKATITSAVIGLAIALAAPTFLVEIQTILGGSTTANPDELNRALTIKQIVMNTLHLLLSVVGIIAIISLVIGGAFYLTAYGDEDRAKKGKTIITNSLIGIVVVMAALVIVSQVDTLLKGV